MSKKWYIITAECIRFQSGLNYKVGEVVILARVIGYNNASVCANALQKRYKPEIFKIKIL